MTYKIKYAGDHVEVLNAYGDFVLSADNAHEAQEEIRSMEAA